MVVLIYIFLMTNGAEPLSFFLSFLSFPHGMAFLMIGQCCTTELHPQPEHLFMCLLSIHVFSLEKSLFKSSVLLQHFFGLLLLSCKI
jgi:hypothetical protein